MTLEEFHQQIMSEVRAEMGDRMGSTPYPYPESVFCETVMEHMAEAGILRPAVAIISKIRKCNASCERIRGLRRCRAARPLCEFVFRK